MTKTSLTWEGRSAVLPDSLLVLLEDGKKYLKIQASHYILVRLLLGKASGSLSAAPGLEDLKHQRELKVAQEAKKQVLNGPQDLFEDEAEDAKVPLALHGSSITLDNGLQIGLQKKHKSNHDLLVLLDPNMLEKAFKIIAQDFSCPRKHGNPSDLLCLLFCKKIAVRMLLLQLLRREPTRRGLDRSPNPLLLRTSKQQSSFSKQLFSLSSSLKCARQKNTLS